MNLRGGIALMPLEWFTFAFDLDRTQDEDDLMFHAGVEGAFPLTEDVGAALRLGLNDGDLTAGLGVQVKMLEFNYAFMEEPEGFLGESHRIGVTLRFGDEDCPFDSRLRTHLGTTSSRGGRDRDLDGIPDGMDACPDEAEDFDGFEDTDGCPDVDNDGDGILDVNDKCPDQAEDFDGFEDSDGCPDIDNDKDGILDVDDRCPDQAENFNRYRDADGCPDKMPVQLPMANITFKTGSAEISSVDPLPVLDNVVKIMNEQPDIRVRIAGHTDNVGADAMNMDLSKRRAEAVQAYMVSKGVASSRLVTEGMGETMPIDSNDTAEGRGRNRRIEFEVID
ncbi:MAG: OmpA family protein [Candidatus Eisenbacteria sp.]|nr:OmpA family protein [Candidatus Eisenbacteria bacterium]